MEYCAAERKKECVPFATAWMELENIMPSEISQLVKDKYCLTYKRDLMNEENKRMDKIEPQAWKHGTD